MEKKKSKSQDVGFEHYFRLLVYAFLLLEIILVPIAQPTFLKLHDISEIPKVTLIRLLTSFALIIWSIWVYVSKRELNLPNKIISLGVLFFLISWIISTFFSTNFYLSFFGSYMRQMGFLTYFFYFVLFFLLYDIIETHTEIRYFYWGMILATFVVDIFGVLQLYRLMPWFERVRTESRIISTLGHADFLGHFLVMMLPISLSFFYETKNILLKTGLGILFLISFLVLLGSYTRGSWVAFIGSLFLFYVFILIKERKIFDKVNKIFSVVLILGMILVIGIFYVTEQELYIKRQNVGVFSLRERFESIGAGLGVTQSNPRVLTWRDSMNLLKEKILTSPRIIYGLGPETFSFNFTPYKSLDLARYDRGKGYPDREHNEFLDILFPQGILGLFSFVFIILGVFIYSMKNYKYLRVENRVLFIGTLMGWIAFLIQGLVLFGLSATYLYFWVLTAFILLYFKIDDPNSTWKIKFSNIMSISKLVLLFVFTFISVFSIWISLRFFRAEIYYRYGLDYLSSGEVGKAASILEEAIRLRPQETAFHEATVKAYLGIIGGTEDENMKLEAFNKGESHINGLIRNAYYRSLTYNLVGAFYAQSYHYFGQKDKSYLFKAEEYFRKALTFDKYSVPPMENLLRMYINDLKDREKALEFAKRILEVDPYHIEAGSYLAKEYFKEGKYLEAKEIYEKLLSQNQNSVELLYNLALINYNLRNYEKSEELLLKVLDMDPLYESAINLLKIVYRATGRSEKDIKIKVNEKVYIQKGLEAFNNKDYYKALEFFKKALEINPTMVETMNNLGASFYMVGKYDEAIYWFKKAIDHKKDYSQAYGNLAYAYLQKGEIEEAEKVIQKGLTYIPKDQNLLELRKKIEEIKKERR